MQFERELQYTYVIIIFPLSNIHGVISTMCKNVCRWREAVYMYRYVWIMFVMYTSTNPELILFSHNSLQSDELHPSKRHTALVITFSIIFFCSCSPSTDTGPLWKASTSSHPAPFHSLPTLSLNWLFYSSPLCWIRHVSAHLIPHL